MSREEPHRRQSLDRALVLFHYEHAMAHGDPLMAVATIEKQSFGHAPIEVALLANASRKIMALYRARRGRQAGYEFRRLHPELDGEALASAVHRARSEDIAGLVALGLSYGEIGSLTGRSPSDIRKALRRS